MKKNDFWMYLHQLEKVSSLLMKVFKDESKVELWLQTSNPLLGNQVPLQMLYIGRGGKLIKFITSQMEENHV